MPPKVKTTREEILCAAFKLTRERGWESVNARSISHEIGCSTQPIYRVFENMSTLKTALYASVEQYYNQYIISQLDKERMFRSVGVSYIHFAEDEPNLFKMLFMTDKFKVKSLMEMIESDEDTELAAVIARSEKLSIDEAKTLYVETWLFTHGIASMVATNSCSLEEDEIQKLLSDAYLGFLGQIKKKENKL
ncbi:MAG TPA: TetR/AcrR family transcriptional regulator [Caproicibacter sp.]|nr:TetR/AcrR family transcriptional regulator [Caproicibacter sp.]